MSTILRTVGIDISKDWLDAFAAPERRTSRFSNDGTCFRKLIAWMGSGVDRIAYEPTGPFHRDFEDILLKAGLDLYAINPFPGSVFRPFARPTRQDISTVDQIAHQPAASQGAAQQTHERKAQVAVAA